MSVSPPADTTAIQTQLQPAQSHSARRQSRNKKHDPFWDLSDDALKQPVQPSPSSSDQSGTSSPSSSLLADVRTIQSIPRSQEITIPIPPSPPSSLPKSKLVQYTQPVLILSLAPPPPNKPHLLPPLPLHRGEKTTPMASVTARPSSSQSVSLVPIRLAKP